MDMDSTITIIIVQIRLKTTDHVSTAVLSLLQIIRNMAKEWWQMKLVPTKIHHTLMRASDRSLIFNAQSTKTVTRASENVLLCDQREMVSHSPASL